MRRRIAAWRHPKRSLEAAGEMALIAKTRAVCHFRERELRRQKLSRPVDAQDRLISVGRHAHLPMERATR